MKLKRLAILPISLLLVGCTFPIDADKVGEVVSEILENHSEKVAEREITKVTINAYEESEKRHEGAIQISKTNVVASYDLDNHTFYTKEWVYSQEVDVDGDSIEEESYTERFIWVDDEDVYAAEKTVDVTEDEENGQYVLNVTSIDDLESQIKSALLLGVAEANPTKYISHLANFDQDMYETLTESLEDEEDDKYQISFGSNGDGSFSYSTFSSSYSDVYHFVEEKSYYEANNYLTSKVETLSTTVSSHYSDGGVHRIKEVLEFNFDSSTFSKPNIDDLELVTSF